MAKILAADDNSNVQKTVALALAELGVEVVSVSNGEAAVRKLGEMTPDLVLAESGHRGDEAAQDVRVLR